MTQARLKRHYRDITRRIIIQGQLVLDTPTCFGNGDTDADTDLALLRDSVENKALLTGASIAGALRNYLRERQGGYDAIEHFQTFGGKRGDEEGDQSPVIINDALSSHCIAAELRDGVKINSTTGTAADQAKYDLELLQAGTAFNLRFELLLDAQDNNESALIQEFAIALQGLENLESGKSSEISIGMKKRRGFGRCHVEQWQVWDFDMTEEGDRLAWLTFDRIWTTHRKPPIEGKIFDILQPQNVPVDQRDRLTIQATFDLNGSLLIRSGHAETGKAPDVVHLKSKRGNTFEPVLSGTSLAGVLRHRAERIVKTLSNQTSDAPSPLIDEIFGMVDETSKKAKSSRLLVDETVIENTADLVQNRIAIDRFTGGAYHGALFDEQPVFGGDESTVTVSLELRQPKKAEIGLLLLLLKDLWTSDLPVGGGSSIGRGRLRGKEATLTWQCSTPEQWKIKQEGDRLKLEDLITPTLPEAEVRGRLETYVAALVNYKSGEEKQ